MKSLKQFLSELHVPATDFGDEHGIDMGDGGMRERSEREGERRRKGRGPSEDLRPSNAFAQTRQANIILS